MTCMFNWFKKLTYKAPKRKERVVLSIEAKKMLEIDYMINKMTKKDISEKYNVSVGTVYRILRGR